MTAPVTPTTAKSGDLLLRFEGAEYYTIPVVYRINRDGELNYYCTLRDWPATDAGKAAGFVAEIEGLRNKLADVEGIYLERITELQLRIAELEGIQKQTAPDLPDLEAADDEADQAILRSYPYCPECGEGPFKARVGWHAHRRIKHGVR